LREGKKIRKPELADAKELQSQSRRLLRKLGKGFVNTWKLYKSSKIGVAGLAIVVGFLIMAIFAPWIAPYDRDFRAPSLDVFIADYANLPLVEEYNWTKVVGLTSEERNERPLERIMVYSDEGKAKVFPVERGISNISGELGIVVKEPSIFTVPAHSWYLEYAHFSRGSIIFFMNTTQAVVELALSIASFTYGGLLGTFLLGVLFKRPTQEDALAGFVAGIFIMVIVISLKVVAWTWFTLVGVTATLMVGGALSLLGRRGDESRTGG